MTTFSRLDVADYLTDEATIAEYLNAALEEGDSQVLLMAIRDVVQARGVANLAESVSLDHAGLYDAFAPGTKPSYETVMKLIKALGVKLVVKPARH